MRELLEIQGIPHAVNPRMVRGLDYYNRTTFALLSGALGAQNAVAAGGRYDGLSETLGGPRVPALGFAAGIERLVLLLGDTCRPGAPTAYLVHRGEDGVAEALRLRRELGRAGLRADLDYQSRSFKAQLRAADRRGARFALILGEDELAEHVVTVKDLAVGTQTSVPAADLAALLRNRMDVAGAEPPTNPTTAWSGEDRER